MTAATGKPRGRPKGLTKSGGRVAGGKSLDKQARQLVSSELAGSILETFRQLGGTADMVSWAANNRTTFYTQILARLYPAPQKDDEAGNNTFNQFNLGGDSFESARRVAFLLSSAMHPDPSVVIEHDIPAERASVEPVIPQEMPRWRPPSDAPDMTEPELDPERAEWAASLPLTPEERRDQALVRETREVTIESYHGSSAEQGHGAAQRSDPVDRDPRAAQRDRMLRRNQLL